MKIPKPEYQNEISTAETLLSQLQLKLQEVDELLDSDPQNTSHLRRRQKIRLDITITENELEDALMKIRK